MKKLLLFTFALFLWTGAWADKTIYLNPGMWAANDPNYDVYVFNGTEDNDWIEMDMSAPVIVNGVTCYKAVVPTKWASMTIVRHNPNTSRTSWKDDEKWNQSQNITLSEVADNTLFTVTDWGNATPSANPVATYTAKFVTNKNWTITKAYAWSATSTNLGNWGGTVMTNDGTYSSLGTSSKKYSISFKAAPAPQKIIFNNGDDPGVEGDTKTGDLTFVDGETYFLGTEENLAYGATVSWGDDENHTETINGDATLSNITDGNDATNVQVILNGDKTVMSVVLDLGEAKTFNSLMINQTGDRWNTSFRIYVSDNNSAWTEVTANTTGVTLGRFIATFTAQTARYLKYVSSRTEKNNPDQWGAGLAEIQLYNLASLPTLESITLTASTSEPIVNDVVVLTAVGISSIDGVKIGLGDITWNNNNTDAGTITDGIYTAKAVGESQVSATAGGKTSNTVSITVQSQTLGNFIMPRYIFPAKTAQDFYVSPKTTEGNDFVGSVSYALSAVSAGANAGSLGYNPQANNHIVFGAGGVEGTYRLTGTANEVNVSRDFSLVENGPINPTASLSDVLALYSDYYGATTLYTYPTNYEWGYESKNELNLSGNKCAYVHKLGTYGFEYPNDADLTQYVTLHFDVFTPTATQGKVWIEKTNIKNVPFVTNAGEWTPIDISLEGLTPVENINYLVHIYFGEDNSDKDRDVLIDNVYFVKEAASDVEKPEMVSAALKSKTHNSATLTLNATDDSGKVMFHIEDATNGVDVTTNKANSGVDYVYTLNDLNSNTSYSFTITALDASNNTSDNSKVVNVTTDAAPAVILLAEGTGTTGTDGGGSAGLEYSYRIVQTGDDVTATFTCTNSESYTGLTPIIWDNTSGFVETYGNTKKMTYSVGTEIRVACKWAYAGGMSVTPYINYVVKEAEANASIAAACNDGKETPTYYSTYSNRNAFVVPADVTVSEMGVDANGKLSIVAYNTGEVVPANTGVLISSSTAGTPEFKLTGEAGTSVLGENNRLRGTSDGIDVATMAANDENCLFYRLTMHNGTDLGFWWGAPEGAAFAVAANKAYLAIPNGLAGAKDGFNIVGLDDGSETDGINKVNTLVETGVRYNLAGQRVGNDYKGIVIVNGRKVVIK